MKKNTGNDEQLLHALEESINTWYTRANGISVGKQCQVCRIMKKIASDPNDICFDCPVSKCNNNEGCPDYIQQYKEAKKEEDLKTIARNTAEFLDTVKIAYLNGRYT